MSQTRRLAAILAADVAGYSRLMGADEEGTLERLYVRLAEEYELRDRDRALDRKLDVISRTVETLLGLVQTRSSLRVEWYIVLLIVAELLLTTYPLILGR